MSSAIYEAIFSNLNDNLNLWTKKDNYRNIENISDINQSSISLNNPSTELQSFMLIMTDEDNYDSRYFTRLRPPKSG